MYSNKPPLCKTPLSKLHPSDYTRKKVKHNSGAIIEETHYKDGSSTVHWGGPVGDSHYDSNGEEC